MVPAPTPSPLRSPVPYSSASAASSYCCLCVILPYFPLSPILIAFCRGAPVSVLFVLVVSSLTHQLDIGLLVFCSLSALCLYPLLVSLLSVWSFCDVLRLVHQVGGHITLLMVLANRNLILGTWPTGALSACFASLLCPIFFLSFFFLLSLRALYIFPMYL